MHDQFGLERVGSPGTIGSNHHLRQSLVFLSMPVLQQPEAYFGGAAKLFGEDGSIANEDTRAFVRRFLEAFATWIGNTGPAVVFAKTGFAAARSGMVPIESRRTDPRACRSRSDLQPG